MFLRATSAAVAALLLGSGVLPAQNVTVQGRVLERGTGDAIPGATVELSGARATITNPNGAFRFTSVRPGRRTLTVQMIGYQRRAIQFEVRSDTTLTVELEVEAVSVDPVTVRSRSYSIRGQVTDSATGKPVMDADVFAGRDRTARTNGMGRYRVSRVPVGPSVLLEVRAPGFMPTAVELDADRDTAVNVVLRHDPVAQRMIAIQIEKLVERTERIPYSTRSLPRAELMGQYYNYSLADILRTLSQTSLYRPQCVLLDERLLGSGDQELAGFLPDQIERIEVIDRGTMVRIYTRRYVMQMLNGQARPGPIHLFKPSTRAKTGARCQ